MRALSDIECGQEMSAINLVLLGTLRLKLCILQHALEEHCRFGQFRLISLQPFLLLVKELLESCFQGFPVSAALDNNGACRLIVEQREQEMFKRHVFVAALDRLLQGRVQRILQFFGNHQGDQHRQNLWKFRIRLNTIGRFFDSAEQGKLVGLGEARHFRDLHFRDLVSIKSDDPDAFLMHLQHELYRFIFASSKNS